MLARAGFRYVELTFPGAKDQPPPSLETLTAINVRSSVDLAGDLTFGDEMLQKVHVSLVHRTGLLPRCGMTQSVAADSTTTSGARPPT